MVTGINQFFFMEQRFRTNHQKISLYWSFRQEISLIFYSSIGPVDHDPASRAEPGNGHLRLVDHGNARDDGTDSNNGICTGIDNCRRRLSVPPECINNIGADGRSFPVSEGKDRSRDAPPFQRVAFLDNDACFRVNPGEEGYGGRADQELPYPGPP